MRRTAVGSAVLRAALMVSFVPAPPAFSQALITLTKLVMTSSLIQRRSIIHQNLWKVHSPIMLNGPVMLNYFSITGFALMATKYSLTSLLIAARSSANFAFSASTLAAQTSIVRFHSLTRPLHSLTAYISGCIV